MGCSQNPWNIRILQEYDLCEIVEINQYFTIFINLKDNRCICFGDVIRESGNWTDEDYQTWFEWWIVVGKPILVEDESLFKQKSWILKPESTKVIAKGIPQLFKRIRTYATGTSNGASCVSAENYSS